MSDKSQKPDDHAEEKTRLECEKLSAEIRALNKSLFRTPGFYSAVAPMALAVLGLVFTWSSGWFDVQRTRISSDKTLLEAQRTRLEVDIKEEQKKFAGLESEIVQLKRERESLQASNALQSSKIDQLSALLNHSGGNSNVNVLASALTRWSATSSVPWIRINSGSSGFGNGTVSYSAEENKSNSSRTGIVFVAGQQLTIIQGGAGVSRNER